MARKQKTTRTDGVEKRRVIPKKRLDAITNDTKAATGAYRRCGRSY